MTAYHPKNISPNHITQEEASTKEIKSIQSDINKGLSVLTKSCDLPKDVIDGILNKNPTPYPNLSSMSECSLTKHAIYGRRFESLMLMFQVQSCSCCGRT